MKDLGKPMVLEEFGYPRDGYLIEPGSPTIGRDGYYAHILSQLVQSEKLQGCCFWAWGGYAQPRHEMWQVGDDYCGDPSQEAQGLNSVFAGDESTLQVVREQVERMRRIDN